MRILIAFFMMFSLVGCAVEQVKVDRAHELVSAGDKMVDVTTQLFSQYKKANSDYMSAFYLSNANCDLTPDYVVHIRTGVPGKTTCLEPSEYDKYHMKLVSEGRSENDNPYFTSVNMSYDDLLLPSTTVLIDGISKYMASLSAIMAGKNELADQILSEAVSNIGAVDGLIKNLNDRDLISTGDFKVADYQKSISDLYGFVSGLYSAHKKSINVDDYMKLHAEKVKGIMEELTRNVNNMMTSMGIWKYSAKAYAMSDLNKVKRTGGKVDKSMLSSITSQPRGMARESLAGSPVAFSMDVFNNAQADLSNLYSDKLNAENKLRVQKETFDRVIDGLKIAADIAKILIM